MRGRDSSSKMMMSPEGGGGLSPRISDRSLVHYVTGGLAGALLLPRVSIDFARMHHPEYLINVELLIWQRQKY